jgi:3-methyladenine DNA glycosylase AlkC
MTEIFKEIDELLDALLLQGSEKKCPENLRKLAEKCRRTGLKKGAQLLEELEQNDSTQSAETYLSLATYRSEWEKELNWEHVREGLFR